jgi:hypothetical protein
MILYSLVANYRAEDRLQNADGIRLFEPKSALLLS